MPVSVRTLSQLPTVPANQLMESSKLEVAVPAEVSVSNNNILYKYVSRSTTIKELSKRMLSSVRDDLIEKNGLSEDINVSDLRSKVMSIAEGDFSFDGTKTFSETPIIDNKVIEDYSLTNTEYDNYSINYGTLKKYSSINSSPLIGPNFGFLTHLSGENGGGTSDRYLNIFKPGNEKGTFSNYPNFLFDENAKTVVPSEYIFKIEPGERTSKPWTAPASGIFTCYGWLDELNNPSQSNEARWVALLGKQAQIGDGDSGWTFLQIQPFAKNSYISYVGFTFPVKKGMMLKVMTGFAVGSNSDKYFASNDSIANHVGNAFLGGIYTGLSADNGMGSNYDYSDVSSTYVTSSDLCSILKHEEECDEKWELSVNNLNERIDELSTIGSKDFIDELSSAISSKNNCIDATNYTRSKIKRVQINFGNGLGYNESPPGVFQDNVFQNIDGELCSAISIDWSNPGTQQRKVEVPEYTTINDSVVLYHPKDYYLSAIEPGTVFSDGKYFYYRVSQNANVQISLNNAPNTNGGAWTFCRLLCGNNNDPESSYKDIQTVLLNTQWNTYMGDGPGKRTVVPLKKDSILMFGYYLRKTLAKKVETNPTINFSPSGKVTCNYTLLNDHCNRTGYPGTSEDVATSTQTSTKWITPNEWVSDSSSNKIFVCDGIEVTKEMVYNIVGYFPQNLRLLLFGSVSSGISKPHGLKYCIGSNTGTFVTIETVGTSGATESNTVSIPLNYNDSTKIFFRRFIQGDNSNSGTAILKVIGFEWSDATTAEGPVSTTSTVQTAPEYLQRLQPPTAQENDTIVSLGDLIDNTSYEKYSNSYKMSESESDTVTVDTVLIRADGANIEEAVNDTKDNADPTKKPYNTAFKQIANIVEIP